MNRAGQEIRLFLAGLFVLFAGLLTAQEHPVCQWIVLPDRLNPHLRPETSSQTSARVLCYPDTVSGRIITGEDQRIWIECADAGQTVYLPKPLLTKPSTYLSSELDRGQITVDRQHALPLNYKPRDMIKIDQTWNYHGRDYPKYLRKDAAQALHKMLETAAKDGIHLRVVSAFRSAQRQRRLYLRKIKRSGLDQKSVAKPGHSEHQLGTTADLSGTDPATVLDPSFTHTREARWLKVNAHHFGFRQTYTSGHSDGYIVEPWHYRFYQM